MGSKLKTKWLNHILILVILVILVKYCCTPRYVISANRGRSFLVLGIAASWCCYLVWLVLDMSATSNRVRPTISTAYTSCLYINTFMHFTLQQWTVATQLGVMVFRSTSLSRWSPHPSLWCCSSPRPSTICQQELFHCASLSTQHVGLSGVRLCQPDSLEFAAWWT